MNARQFMAARTAAWVKAGGGPFPILEDVIWDDKYYWDSSGTYTNSGLTDDTYGYSAIKQKIKVIPGHSLDTWFGYRGYLSIINMRKSCICFFSESGTFISSEKVQNISTTPYTHIVPDGASYAHMAVSINELARTGDAEGDKAYCFDETDGRYLYLGDKLYIWE